MDTETSSFANAFHRFQEWKDGTQNNEEHSENDNESDDLGTREEATIEINKLNIYIQGNHILKDVSLTLYDKKITCIIGPSGCGKTTLLKSINRMIDTTEHVKVEGSVLV
ncbi:MAG: ATP-binding cassette domain-containing protein, partial [Bacteroides sp.]